MRAISFGYRLRVRSTPSAGKSAGACQEKMFRTIVVGTDGSRTADRAVRRATDLARLCSARLHLVTAYRSSTDMTVIGPMGSALAAGADDEVPADIAAMLHRLENEVSADGVTVTVHAVAARAADAILDVAEEEQADLIVVGNRGVQGSRPFLGSVPLNVLQHARCPVIVFPTSLVADEDSPPA
jgi:nucleotide-binding universal stress UspA family protein